MDRQQAVCYRTRAICPITPSSSPGNMSFMPNRVNPGTITYCSFHMGCYTVKINYDKYRDFSKKFSISFWKSKTQNELQK